MDECLLCVSEKEGTILLLEMRRGALLKTFKGCNSQAGALCVLAGPRSFQGNGGAGDYIYAAQDKRAAVNVWNWANSNAQLQCHVQEIMSCLCAHPSGQYLFAGGRSGKLYVWQSASGALIRTVNAHYRGITRCKVSRCGTYLVTASEDSTVSVWSVSDLVENPTQHAPAIRAFKSLSVHSLPVLDVCIMGAGLSARIATASADRTVKIIQVCSGETLQTLSFPTAITVCATNQTEDVLLAGGENGTVYMVDMHATAAATTMAHSRVHGKQEGLLNGSGSLNMHTLTGHEGAITSLVVSADNVTCASASSDATIRVWDLETRQCVNVSKPHSNGITDIVIIPRPDLLSTTVNKPTLIPVNPLRKYADNAGDLDRHRILLTPVDVDAVPIFDTDADEPARGTPSGQKRTLIEATEDAVSSEDAEDGFLSLPKVDAAPVRTLREALVMPHIDQSAAEGLEPADAAASLQELEALRQQVQELNTENERWRTVAKKLKTDLDAARTTVVSKPEPATPARRSRVSQAKVSTPTAAPTPAPTPARSTRKSRRLEVEPDQQDGDAEEGDSIATRVRTRRKSMA